MAKSSGSEFAIGMDFGTNSVRTVIVNVADGKELAAAVAGYPSGKEGVLLDAKDPNLARQHPGDYIKSLAKSVKAAMTAAGRKRGFNPSRIVGIGVDTTGSTPLPVDETCTPLGMKARFRKDLAAQAWLWKDHTSHAEAAEITDHARDTGTPYLAKCGGTYSSEWYWSKILHCKRTSPQVFDAAWSWLELADYMPAYLTGANDPAKIARSVCAAGHKAMYHQQWDGLPKKGFLAGLAPELAQLRDHYFPVAVPSDHQAGVLDKGVAKKLGLPAGLPVAVGMLDAHAGAVGAGIKPGTLVKIIGTSTCDMMVVPEQVNLPDIPGLCGIVPGSIVPGMYGLEAGQSAVGDIFNWFVSNLAPAPRSAKVDPHDALTREAAQLAPGQSGLLALDWNNGNRTILVDPLLSGLLIGQTLHTTAAEIYRALIEATAFGALTIIKQFEQYGVKVKQVLNCGGIAEKNALLMQIYADVCNRPMLLSRSDQTCALGAAIFGAVVGGAYHNVEEAQRRMTGVRDDVIYKPDRRRAATYANLYEMYRNLHDAFGTTDYTAPLHHVMKELISIRDEVRAE